jgi:penicillin-binding protein 1C
MQTMRRKLKLFQKKYISWAIVFCVGLIFLFGGIAAWVLADLPSIDSLDRNTGTPSVRITDRYGRLLYEMLPQGEGRHTIVALEDLPLALQQATIATEDSSFYQNPGVDVVGIVRATWINLQGGETLAGGSTITQQVARTLLLSDEERSQRSIRRKLRESVLAWQLARRYSKSQILALYLNHTYYGAMTYGVEAATQTYFGKSAADLDLAEAALLAGLPQSPALYNPFSDLEAAQKRRSVVLGLMEKQGYITAEQQELADREPVLLAGSPYPMEAPHFVMMVRAKIDTLFTLEDIQKSGGLVVRTSLDLDWQHLAENAVTEQLERLKNSPNPVSANVNNAAVVVLDPKTGEIRAMVGSPDYNDEQHSGALNMALSPRQPGSALKPFIYALAMDPTQSDPWTPATMLLDVNTHFTTHDGKLYTPVNYDGREHGPVLVREALASSLNVPAVLTLDHVGLSRLFDFLDSLGITTLGNPDDNDLSFALGGGEVRLVDLTAAYGALANGGFAIRPNSILTVSASNGRVLYQAAQERPRRVIDARVTWLISDILSDDNARMLGFGRNSALRLDRPAAVKTGTTTNFHDNWTVGYTPSLVVGVWAGNASHEAMHDVTGLTGAGPIWHQVIRSILAGSSEESFQKPDGIVREEVCSLSGQRPTTACEYRCWEWFIDGTQPAGYDTLYRQVTLQPDATGGQPRVITTLDLPPSAEPWARDHGWLLWKDLQNGSAFTRAGGAVTAVPSTQAAAPLVLLSPGANTVYHLTPNLPGEDQQIQLTAAGEEGLTRVRLWVDGLSVAMDTDDQAASQSPFTGWWTLTIGKHVAWADALRSDGSQVTSEKVSFEVVGAVSTLEPDREK